MTPKSPSDRPNPSQSTDSMSSSSQPSTSSAATIAEGGTKRPPSSPGEEAFRPDPAKKRSPAVGGPTPAGRGDSAAAADTSSSAEASPSSQSVVDVCGSLGLKAGDRVEVMWDVHFEEDDSEGNGGARDDPGSTADAGSPEGPTAATDAERREPRRESRWWGATLLLHDGRTHVLSDEEDDGGGDGDDEPSLPSSVSAALRVLDYDPYPEGGFPDRSLEEVVFLSDRSILNVGSGTRAHWRREGDAWEPGPEDEIDEDGVNDAARGRGVDQREGAGADEADSIPLRNPEEDLRSVLDSVLCAALERTSGASKMKMMTAAQRAVVAERIARTKEMMLEKIMARAREEGWRPEGEGGGAGGLITADHVRRCMEEVGREL